MTIEFQCPGCEKLLRVPDESAGKQAQCPECGTVSQIPGLEPAAPAQVRDNPFESPMAESPLVSHQAAAGEIVPTKIDVGEVFGSAWVIFKDRWQTVVGVLLLTWLIMAGAMSIFLVMATASGNNEALQMVLLIPITILSIYLVIGATKVLLAVTRGQQTSFSDIFTDGKLILPYFLAMSVAMLIIQVGFALLIIPGIILGLMFSQVGFLIVDRQVGVFESLRLSREITSGNKITLLAVMLLAALGSAVLNAVTCGIAAVVVVPYMLLVGVVAYLKMSGQPTSAM